MSNCNKTRCGYSTVAKEVAQPLVGMEPCWLCTGGCFYGWARCLGGSVVASSIEVHLRGHIAATCTFRRGLCTPSSVVLSRPRTGKWDVGEAWGTHGRFLQPLCRRGGYNIQTKGKKPDGQFHLCKWHLQNPNAFHRTRMCMDNTYMRPFSSLARTHLSNHGVIPSKKLGSGGPGPVSGSAWATSKGAT